MADRSESTRSWLIDVSSRALPVEELIAGVSERLLANGVPLWRTTTSVLTKHPELFVRNIEWIAGEGATIAQRWHHMVEQRVFLDSPVHAIRQGASQIRCRLSGPDADLRYPICRDLAAQGATEYFALPIEFGDGQRTFVSWATKCEGGFTDADLDALSAVKDVLALRLELESHRFTTRSLLEVYLGQNAATRVLNGAFKRGHGESIRAAIWFCDMRGFTALADRAPASEVVATLDRFFECVAGPIGARGGEILKFIGDAVLAIFPVQGDASGVCADALAAAEDALTAIDRMNEDRDPKIGLGIALHLGDVMYGNIGASNRLDFTVIGAAVNEVTRVESMCRPLGARLLLTSAFVYSWRGSTAQSLGKHVLKGVSEPQEIFTLGGTTFRSALRP
jgi:adenylate cyclase